MQFFILLYLLGSSSALPIQRKSFGVDDDDLQMTSGLFIITPLQKLKGDEKAG